MQNLDAMTAGYLYLRYLRHSEEADGRWEMGKYSKKIFISCSATPKKFNKIKNKKNSESFLFLYFASDIAQKKITFSSFSHGKKKNQGCFPPLQFFYGEITYFLFS